MKDMKEFFDAIVNDSLTVDQRTFLEQLGKDSRKVVKLESEDTTLSVAKSLVEQGYAEITSDRSTVNFKITKTGKEFLHE